MQITSEMRRLAKLAEDPDFQETTPETHPVYWALFYAICDAKGIPRDGSGDDFSLDVCRDFCPGTTRVYINQRLAFTVDADEKS